MQTLAKVLAVVAVMAFVVPAFGAEGDKPKGKGERPSVYGVLKAVGEGTVTIAMKKDGEAKDVDVKVNADTKVSVDREAKDLAALKDLVGKRAAAWCTDGVATRIAVMTKAPEHKKPKEKN